MIGPCIGTLGTIAQVVLHAWNNVTLVLVAFDCEFAELYFVRTAGTVVRLKMNHHG